MKRIFYTLAMLLMSICMQAQILEGDMNHDGNLSIEDVTKLVNLVLNPASKTYTYSVEQFISDNKLTGEYTINGKETYYKKGIESKKVPNLLPGKFTVAEGKQVQFTKGNLYWDEYTFHLEENQTDYPTSIEWKASHTGHFFWTTLSDYQTVDWNEKPYAIHYYYYNEINTNDKFWCNEDNPLTVDGINGLYVLTGGTSGEWYYLLKSRANASNLYKYGVTVTNDGTNYTNCLIIAPDDFTGLLQSNYTLDEVNDAGLVCFPAASVRLGSSLDEGGTYCSIWSSTPSSSDSSRAYSVNFDSGGIKFDGSLPRFNGCCIRLVRTVE